MSRKFKNKFKYRSKSPKRVDKKYFSKNAAKTQSANIRSTPMRGGIRM